MWKAFFARFRAQTLWVRRIATHLFACARSLWRQLFSCLGNAHAHFRRQERGAGTSIFHRLVHCVGQC